PMRPTRLALLLFVLFLLASSAPPSSDAQPPHDILGESCVLTLPGMAAVKIDTGLVYREVDGLALKMDFFHPSAPAGRAGKGKGIVRAPLVIFANGVGVDQPPLRRWGIYQSWGRLVAVSGMAAVTHDSRRTAPREDLETLVTHLRSHADKYGIDPDNIAIWACSANLQHGSWYALNPANVHVKAAVFYYGNVDTTFLRTDLPVLVGRAGLDNLGTNASLDNFLRRALQRNAAVTLLNIPNGRHAFDLVDPQETSRDAVRTTLDFLRSNLTSEMQAARAVRDLQRRTVERHGLRDWEGTIAAGAAWLEQEPSAAQGRHLMGDAYYNLRRYREAAESYERAGDAGWNVAVTFYNGACAWALAGDSDRAIRNLEKALATGFITDRRPIPADPDFATVKDDPRFRRLIETP
ncbi:MAG TPA: hypothetical protein VFU59_00795, partial [Candidatus Eisenbacteria bacterium]|nr:hypothetical protein [Candidatus Eisenbacteria bacterium]